MNLNEALLIANASMCTRKVPDTERFVSGSAQKATLLVLWANPGLTMSYRAIAERAGCSQDAVRRSIAVLENRGIVIVEAGADKRARTYHVNVSRLADLAACSPWVMPTRPSDRDGLVAGRAL